MDCPSRAYLSSTMSSTPTSAMIATPSSSNSGRFTAEGILSAALGWRAMLSAAAAANFPNPSAAPITIMPSPSAAPKKCREPCMRLSSPPSCLASVMNVNGHADEHGRQQSEHVRLHHDDDDLQPGDRHRQGNRHRRADAHAGDRLAGHLGEDEDQRQ